MMGLKVNERSRVLNGAFLKATLRINELIPDDTCYLTIFQALTHAYQSHLNFYKVSKGDTEVTVSTTLEKALFDVLEVIVSDHHLTIGELTSFFSSALQSLSKDCIRLERDPEYENR
jgi:hypothetical protein